jgi:hypothetical protein
VRGTGSRRDFARPNDGANLRLDPVRSRSTASSEVRAARLVSRFRPRKRRDARRRWGEVRHLSPQNEELCCPCRCPCIVVFAEVGRTSSGSEKRATSRSRVESLATAKERVDGSLTIEVAQARKRGSSTAVKGGRIIVSSAILIT